MTSSQLISKSRKAPPQRHAAFTFATSVAIGVVISVVGPWHGCPQQGNTARGETAKSRASASTPTAKPRPRNRALAAQMERGAPHCELYYLGVFENCENADRVFARVKALAADGKQAEDASQTLGSFLRSPDRNTRALAANGLQLLPATSKRSLLPFVLQTIELETDEFVVCALAKAVNNIDASAPPQQQLVLAAIAQLRARPRTNSFVVATREVAIALVPIHDNKLAEAGEATKAWILGALASPGTDHVAALSLLGALGSEKAKACQTIIERLPRDSSYEETIELSMASHVCDDAGWRKMFAFVTSKISRHPAPSLMNIRLRQLEHLVVMPQELRSAAAKEFTKRHESLKASFNKTPTKDSTQQQLQQHMLSELESSARYFAQVRSSPNGAKAGEDQTGAM